MSDRFDPASLADGVDAYLATSEAQVAGLDARVAKRVVWSGAPEDQTDWAVVYLHGFSATSEEIRPVPDKVAEALGANLYFARFTGHGLDGDALGQASLDRWLQDMDEALAIGRAIGRRVLLIGTSTGATLATLAAMRGLPMDGVAGFAFVSPNFGLRPKITKLLDWPKVDVWGPYVAGKERGFQPQNADHAAFWTTQYPFKAVLPMAEAVRGVWAGDLGALLLPALMVYSPDDRIVSPAKTEKLAEKWGGVVELCPIAQQDGMEPDAHVIAGDILSPGITGMAAEKIVAWVRALPE